MLSRNVFSIKLGLGLALFGAIFVPVTSYGQAAHKVRYPDALPGPMSTVRTRGADGTEKMTPELRGLYRQYDTPRSAGARRYSEKELRERFGIEDKGRSPIINACFTLAPSADAAAIAKGGATVWYQAGNLVYAAVPILRLHEIAPLPSVIAIAAAPQPTVPDAPDAKKRGEEKPAKVRGSKERGAAKLADAFDAQGLTGKGVLVAVIDSGIDWRHPDFIRADGSSRIVALWDMYDASWEKSGGAIGSKPPMTNPKTGAPMGTLYTQAQITAALAGTGTVNSQDLMGHGTACAGIAAGSGRAAANGVPEGTYAGVAPDADLIVVKAAPPSVEKQGGLGAYTEFAAQWVMDQAAARNEPVVVNMSYGHQNTPHDGTDEEEIALNELVGAGKPGRAICAAAGNEGRDAFHASGVFGPRLPGEQDIASDAVELIVAADARLEAYFDHGDGWGLSITGLDRFLVDAKGQPVDLLLVKGTELLYKFSGEPDMKNPDAFVAQTIALTAPLPRDAATDQIALYLPPGRYEIHGFGATDKVSSGRFDLYLPQTSRASFGKGVSADGMIGSPGCGSNVLTVGSYDFRGMWQTGPATASRYNIRAGSLSAYSSPGFRRDGVVKPEIMAPARFAISSLAKGSVMGKEASGVTLDGLHLAWDGTSAASPYAAGVAALLLQADPTLDAAQIRDLLIKTATEDAFTGKVPNPKWGYGKIAPAAAIKAVLGKKKSAK